MHQAKRWGATTALLLIAVPACTSTSAPSDPPAASKPPTPATSPDRSGFTFDLPIARYSYTEKQRTAIESAKNSLTDACMSSFGIEYRSPETNVSLNSSDRRYGLSNATEARQYGYHLPPDPGPAEIPDGSVKLNILFGQIKQHKGKEVPHNGCRGSSVAELNGKFTNGKERDTAREISVVSYEKARTDSRVTMATRSWSRCMSKLDFSYASPQEALSDFSLENPTASVKEIKTATADVECKKKTEFLQSWFSVESEIQEKMIRENRAALNDLLENHAQNVKIAQSVIADSR
ncbi:hypothetical protein ACFWSJ_19440 [Streptomyces niveus]|uniref:hypothetical protein n=1 Tax=Streptomyces niveus TaxID=193462 RepID=UPI00364C9739